MSSTSIKPKKRGATKKELKLLNPQQRLFVQYILADPTFNATVSAREAGYKSPSSAAQKLMSEPHINAAIGKALQDRLSRITLTADDVLEHLRNALFLDPIHLFAPGPNGTWVVKQLDQIPEHIRRCITKIKSRTRTWVENEEELTETWFELEFIDKNSALAMVMKHLGISGENKSKVDVNINSTETLLLSLINEVTTGTNVVDAPKGTEEVLDVVSTPAKLEHTNGKPARDNRSV